MTETLVDKIVEETARAMAIAEGRGPEFNRCKEDEAYEEIMGHYGGYTAEAYDVLEDAGVIRLVKDLTDADKVAAAMKAGKIAKLTHSHVKDLFSELFNQ